MGQADLLRVSRELMSRHLIASRRLSQLAVTPVNIIARRVAGWPTRRNVTEVHPGIWVLPPHTIYIIKCLKFLEFLVTLFFAFFLLSIRPSGLLPFRISLKL
jgi:hypothetical protein